MFCVPASPASEREGPLRNATIYRKKRTRVPWSRGSLSAVAVAVMAVLSLVATGAAPAVASPAGAAGVAAAGGKTANAGASPSDRVQPSTPSDVPYALPVQLPATTTSPAVASNAPYTPAVLNLIAQLEPDTPPTDETPKVIEQHDDFLLRERGTRLIEHENAAFFVHRAHDFEKLLVADPEGVNGCVGCDGEAEIGDP